MYLPFEVILKPTLLLDVDGVLADFVSAALTLVHQVTGRQHKPSDITTWELFDSLGEPKEVQDAVYRVLKGRGGCTSIPAYDGAKEAIARLRKVSNIVIVTSPFSGSETWAHERGAWLKTHFDIDAEDVIYAKNKSRIHGDFFVDDKPEHVQDWIDYWTARYHGSAQWAPKNCGLLWSTDRTIDAPSHLQRLYGWRDLYNLLE